MADRHAVYKNCLKEVANEVINKNKIKINKNKYK